MQRHKHKLLTRGKLDLRQLTSSRRPAWLLALVLGTLTLIATVGLLALSGWFISAAALAGLLTAGAVYSFNFFVPGAIIRFFAIVRTAGRYGERLASHHAVLALLADLRSVLFVRLQRSPIRQLRLYSAQQMHRLTSDVETLNEWPLAMLLPWGWAGLLLAGYFLFVAWVSPLLLLWLLPPLLLLAVVIPAFAAWRNIALTRISAAQSEARRSALLTPLGALTALLQWSRWTDFAAAFLARDHDYNHTQLRSARLINLCTLLQQLGLIVTIGLLLWRGALLVQSGDVSVPLLLALLLGLLGLGEVLLPLVRKADALGKSIAARDRLNQLLDFEHIDGNRELMPLPQDGWQLHLQQVSARQPQAFNGPDAVSLTLQQGDVLVIDGPSGGGKSTLLDVLAGELLPDDGQILLNGKAYDAWDWRGKIGYLAQQWMIFDLTLAENLRLGSPHASDEELWRVLDAVYLRDWACAQPLGLDTPLGEYGAAVSGGQARRIALARLLLKPYPLLLLDEPFAGLDPAMRQALFERLCAHQQHGILILVTHHELRAGQGVKRLCIG
ncbi:thiol reductant ABC exporter subunit CydC [Cardiobacteriaceae bacterium TAE3-ERU3]|nr:thiol reductant ABC exporter subunit CydC [Cardiobacteriaceae bacterium TAE3-ERU3]